MHLTVIPALLAIAIPGFLIAKLISLVLPTIATWITSALGSVIKGETGWESTANPLVLGALHFVTAGLITGVLVKLGVTIVPADLQCLQAANGSGLSCLSSESLNAIVIYLTTLVSSHISAQSFTAHRAWKAARRSRGLR